MLGTATPSTISTVKMCCLRSWILLWMITMQVHISGPEPTSLLPPPPWFLQLWISTAKVAYGMQNLSNPHWNLCAISRITTITRIVHNDISIFAIKSQNVVNRETRLVFVFCYGKSYPRFLLIN